MKTRTLIILLATAALAAVQPGGTAAQASPGAAATPPPALAAEEALFMDAARHAWGFVDRMYVPSTGLVRPLEEYPYATIWDIASGLAALYSAHELGLLPRDEYDRRMSTALRTLQTVPLYDGAIFSKVYSAVDASMTGHGDRPTTVGTGWSAIDVGRLLVWLRIVADGHPQYRGEVEKVVARIDFDRLVREGVLRGTTVPRSGRKVEYQEGRIGYEQYAAEGVALWGHRAERALDFAAHGREREVLGHALLADTRGEDRLTSDPFVLMGLELGWTTPDWRGLAWRLLAVQEERFRRTGRVTIVNEDANPTPPYYFYYYSVLAGDREFAVDAQGAKSPLDGPRTVSTKAAFGWHALLPGPYTHRAVQAVQPARTASGWGAGVDEAGGGGVGSENVNTAAVILEAALYASRGRPLLTRP